jgi:hypothetical protein
MKIILSIILSLFIIFTLQKGAEGEIYENDKCEGLPIRTIQYSETNKCFKIRDNKYYKVTCDSQLTGMTCDDSSCTTNCITGNSYGFFFFFFLKN